MNNFKLRKLFLPLVMLLFVFSSCDLDNSDTKKDDPVIDPPVLKPLQIIGTWNNEYTKLTLTDSILTNYYYNNGEAVKYYDANIVKYTNESEDNTGSIVVLYNGGAGAGKYGVIKWKELKEADGTVSFKYIEGYKRANPDVENDYSGIYFDSADEAEEGMDDSFFPEAKYSTITESLKIIGTWNEQYSRISFSETTYTNYYFVNGEAVKYFDADIVKYSNSDLGYIIVLYNGGAGNGKYGVVKWKELNTEEGKTTMSYLEGYKRLNPDVEDDYSGIYFDSADAAETGMDDSFFPEDKYTSMEKQ